MERFNYPNIQAVLDEDIELIRLLECEQYGYKLDQQEELEETKAQQEAEMRQ